MYNWHLVLTFGGGTGRKGGVHCPVQDGGHLIPALPRQQ